MKSYPTKVEMDVAELYLSSLEKSNELWRKSNSDLVVDAVLYGMRCVHWKKVVVSP